MEVEGSHRRIIDNGSSLGKSGRPGYVEVIRQRILLRGDLSDEQRDRLSYIAGRCPLHRTLNASPVIEEEISVIR